MAAAMHVLAVMDKVVIRKICASMTMPVLIRVCQRVQFAARFVVNHAAFVNQTKVVN